MSAWLLRWGWLLLVVASPFLLLPSPERSPALMVAPALVWVYGRGREARTPLDWPITLLCLMVLVSLYATYDIAFSLTKIAGVLFGVALFYVLTYQLRRYPSILTRVLVGYLLLGGGLAGLSLLGTAWSVKTPWLAPLVSRLPARLFSLSGAEAGVNPNEVAGVMQWFVPLGVAVSGQAVRRVGRPRTLFWLAIPATLITVIVLVLTQSRGGLLGMMAALLVMLWLVSGARLRWGVAVVAVVLAAGAGWYLAGQEGGLEAAVGGTANSGAAESGQAALNSLEGRLEIWSRAIYGIQDFPFTGMGMNTFRRVVPVLYPLFLISPDQDIAHAHNIWLQVALDLGLPGLIAYLTIWIVTIAMLVQVLRGTQDTWLRAVSVGILGCLAGYFVYGITDTVALGAKPGFLWWMLIGLATALWKLEQIPAAPEQ